MNIFKSIDTRRPTSQSAVKGAVTTATSSRLNVTGSEASAQINPRKARIRLGQFCITRFPPPRYGTHTSRSRKSVHIARRQTAAAMALGVASMTRVPSGLAEWRLPSHAGVHSIDDMRYAVSLKFLVYA